MLNATYHKNKFLERLMPEQHSMDKKDWNYMSDGNQGD